MGNYRPVNLRPATISESRSRSVRVGVSDQSYVLYNIFERFIINYSCMYSYMYICNSDVNSARTFNNIISSHCSTSNECRLSAAASHSSFKTCRWHCCYSRRGRGRQLSELSQNYTTRRALYSPQGRDGQPRLYSLVRLVLERAQCLLSAPHYLPCCKTSRHLSPLTLNVQFDCTFGENKGISALFKFRECWRCRMRR